MYTDVEYWRPLIDSTSTPRLPQRVVFVVNYDLKGIEQLQQLAPMFASMHICLANTAMRSALHEEPRFGALRQVPTSVMPSPIEIARFCRPKTASQPTFGAYSFPYPHKWNEHWPSLVGGTTRVGQVTWTVMGMPTALVRRLPASTSVVSLPLFAERPELFLQRLSVFVFYPVWTWEEAWSRSVAEALASGCPVIATNRGGSRDQIEHGVNGFLCDDDEAIRELTLSLASDPALLAQMSRAAQASTERFSHERLLHSISELLG
jgi:glycosyltransferase involved in cell wall biosynthesis